MTPAIDQVAAACLSLLTDVLLTPGKLQVRLKFSRPLFLHPGSRRDDHARRRTARTAL